MELKKNREKTLKGQAALEYLMNYGWAILVIAIVFGILLFMFQSITSVRQCTMAPGFSCSEPLPQVFNSGGRVFVNFKLYNNQPQTITVSHLLCTVTPPAEARFQDAVQINSVDVPPGTSAEFKDLPCKSGSNVLTTPAGQDFKGHVIIWYNYENDIDKSIKKTTTAAITGKIDQRVG